MIADNDSTGSDLRCFRVWHIRVHSVQRHTVAFVVVVVVVVVVPTPAAAAPADDEDMVEWNAAVAVAVPVSGFF